MNPLPVNQINSSLGGNPKIVGGITVLPDPKYSFVTRIEFDILGLSHSTCTGSLYNSNTVITAAHCAQSPAANYTVYSNQFDLTIPAPAQTAKVYSVKKVIPHPKYDPATNQYDIAILKLNVEGYNSQPNINLDSGSLGNDVGLNVTAIGWGQLYSDGPTPAQLQEVQIPIMSADTCKLNNDISPVDMDIEFCAGPADGGKGVCHGDSGGPVGVFKNNKFTLIGTTDWGHNPPCAPPKYGAVFVRVSAFVDWIKSLAN